MKRIIRAGERWGVKDRKKRKICRKRQRKVERYEERGRESYTVYVERVIVMWEDICSKRQRGGNLNKMRDRDRGDKMSATGRGQICICKGGHQNT